MTLFRAAIREARLAERERLRTEFDLLLREIFARSELIYVKAASYPAGMESRGVRSAIAEIVRDYRQRQPTVDYSEYVSQ